MTIAAEKIALSKIELIKTFYLQFLIERHFIKGTPFFRKKLVAKQNQVIKNFYSSLFLNLECYQIIVKKVEKDNEFTKKIAEHFLKHNSRN